MLTSLVHHQEHPGNNVLLILAPLGGPAGALALWGKWRHLVVVV